MATVWVLILISGHCCCCSVTKSCPTLCEPVACSMPGLPVLHHLPEFAQVHVHWISHHIWMAQMVKNLPAVQETWIQFLDLEYPSEKGMATYCSIHARIIPWTEECDGLQSMGLQRVRHNWSNLACTQNVKQNERKRIQTWLPVLHTFQFSLIQLLSHVWLFLTPWTAARQASLSITNFWSLLKLMPIESVMPSNHLILCHPLLLLPSIFPSIRVFSNESALRIR